MQTSLLKSSTLLTSSSQTEVKFRGEAHSSTICGYFQKSHFKEWEMTVYNFVSTKITQYSHPLNYETEKHFLFRINSDAKKKLVTLYSHISFLNTFIKYMYI